MEAIRQHFGGKKRIWDCIPDENHSDHDELQYTFPLAGRRRLAAAKLLAEPNLAVFQQYLEEGEACYEHLFPGATIECRIYEDVPYESAIAIMLSENITQHRPASYKEIYAIQMLWRYTREINPSTTLRQFANRIGLSSQTIRSIIRYVELPEQIRHLAEQGNISKGKVFLLAQLQFAMRKLTRDGHKVWSETDIETALLVHSTVALQGNNAMFTDYLKPFFQEAYGQLSLFPEFKLVAEEVASQTLSRAMLLSGGDFLKVQSALIKGLSNDWFNKSELLKALKNGAGLIGEALGQTVRAQRDLNKLLQALGYFGVKDVVATTENNAKRLDLATHNPSGS